MWAASTALAARWAGACGEGQARTSYAPSSPAAACPNDRVLFSSVRHSAHCSASAVSVRAAAVRRLMRTRVRLLPSSASDDPSSSRLLLLLASLAVSVRRAGRAVLTVAGAESIGSGRPGHAPGRTSSSTPRASQPLMQLRAHALRMVGGCLWPGRSAGSDQARRSVARVPVKGAACLGRAGA